MGGEVRRGGGGRGEERRQGRGKTGSKRRVRRGGGGRGEERRQGRGKTGSKRRVRRGGGGRMKRGRKCEEEGKEGGKGRICNCPLTVSWCKQQL